MKIIENKDNLADGHIFNIGNPHNNYSIAELAEKLLSMARQYPEYEKLAKNVNIVSTSSGKYYGDGYQDVLNRAPKIENAKKYLGWEPKTDLDTTLKITLEYYLKHLGDVSHK